MADEQQLRNLWDQLTRAERDQVAAAFWSSASREEQDQAERYLAARLRFRPQSIHKLAPAKKNEYFVGLLAPVTPELVEAALIQYHFVHKRDLLVAFLDALGIPHVQGEIKAPDKVSPPTAEALRAARATVAGTFPERDVDVYLRTLLVLDPETWGGLKGIVTAHRPE